jgi:hypothetical protein
VRPSLLLLMLVPLVVVGVGYGQIVTITDLPRPGDSAQPPKVDPEVERKALDLVETLSQQVLNLDFDRTRTLADQIGRPEMRVLMEIDLVQTTLGGKPDMNPMFFSGRTASIKSIN